MSHQMILERFFEICRIEKECVDVWFPSGRNSVRIRFKDKKEMIFTFFNHNNWSLETMDHFIGMMRKPR